MLLDLIPDAFDAHGYVQARPGSIGALAPLGLPTGRWTTHDEYPATGSTFSWVRPGTYHGWAVWLLPDDQPKSRADSVRLKSLLGAMTREPGRYQVTWHDDQGPSGHTCRDALEDGVEWALGEDYRVESGEPTSAVEAAMREQWKHDARADELSVWIQGEA